MKKIAIVAATKMEIEPLVSFLDSNATKNSPNQYRFVDYDIDILISGVGILHTSYTLMDYLMDHRPDFWIQAGIGGAFDHSLEIGNVYAIESELLIDFGAQAKDGRIIDPFELDWLQPNEFPYRGKKLICPHIPTDLSIHRASGMTTIHSHGFQEKIEKLKDGLHGQVENMEGAAFFFVSLMKAIPFLSIRAISNIVEARDKKNWKIELATNKVNFELIHILKAQKP